MTVTHRLLALCLQALIDQAYMRDLSLFAGQELSAVTRIQDLALAQHLADDHFNVLVVDLHALQTVHILHFLDNVVGHGVDTAQTQDVMRGFRTFGDHFALLHLLALTDVQVTRQGNHLLMHRDQIAAGIHCTFIRSDHQAALALSLLTKGNGTGDLS